MAMMRTPVLPKNAVREQEKHFRDMGKKYGLPPDVTDTFSQHGIQVASVIGSTLVKYMGQLTAAHNLTEDDIQTLTLLALYHPLHTLDGMPQALRRRLQDPFDRFCRFRKLDEKDLPKDIESYEQMIYLQNGLVDPVFIVRAIDLSQTHDYDAESIEKLYSLSGELVDGKRLRTNISISMLDVYYPISVALPFIDSDSIRDIAVEQIWPDKFAKVKEQCANHKAELERSQFLLLKAFEAAVRRVALENQLFVIQNPEDSYIYTDRIKSEGSIVQKLVRKNLPTSITFANDMHGFLVIMKTAKAAMKLADMMMRELRKMISSSISIDQRYLMPPKDDGTVHPSVSLDFVGPIYARNGQLLSQYGAEIQVTDLEGIKECTQGVLIHGRHKQTGIFNSGRIINASTLPHLLNYRAAVNREATVLDELKTSSVESEYVQISCTISDGRSIRPQQVVLPEGALLIDLLAKLDILNVRTYTKDSKSGKPILNGDQIESREVHIEFEPGSTGINPPQAADLMTRTSDGETIAKLRKIRNGYRKNGQKR